MTYIFYVVELSFPSERDKPGRKYTKHKSFNMTIMSRNMLNIEEENLRKTEYVYSILIVFSLNVLRSRNIK